MAYSDGRAVSVGRTRGWAAGTTKRSAAMRPPARADVRRHAAYWWISSETKLWYGMPIRLAFSFILCKSWLLTRIFKTASFLRLATASAILSNSALGAGRYSPRLAARSIALSLRLRLILFFIIFLPESISWYMPGSGTASSGICHLLSSRRGRPKYSR